MARNGPNVTYNVRRFLQNGKSFVTKLQEIERKYQKMVSNFKKD